MKNLAFLAVVVLAGCANGPTVTDYRKSCLNDSFVEQFSCEKQKIMADERFSGMTHIEEYVLTGEMLTGRVAEDEITDQEARLALLEKLNEIKAIELQAYNARLEMYSAIQSAQQPVKATRPVQTNCQAGPYGSMSCTSY